MNYNLLNAHDGVSIDYGVTFCKELLGGKLKYFRRSEPTVRTNSYAAKTRVHPRNEYRGKGSYRKS